VIMLVALCASLFAFDYPPTLAGLLQKYCEAKTEIMIITNQSNQECIHYGTIRLVQDDYILFSEKDGLIVLSIPNIVEVSLR